jgi:hypothetical protein
MYPCLHKGLLKVVKFWALKSAFLVLFVLDVSVRMTHKRRLTLHALEVQLQAHGAIRNMSRCQWREVRISVENGGRQGTYSSSLPGS